MVSILGRYFIFLVDWAYHMRGRRKRVLPLARLTGFLRGSRWERLVLLEERKKDLLFFK